MSPAPLARALAAAAAALVSLALARAALANAPATYFRDPGHAGAVLVAGKTALEVEREDLSLRCEAAAPSDPEPGCAFEATYHLFNPSQTAEEVAGAFVGTAATTASATMDGEDARYALSDAERAGVDAQVRALDPSLGEDVRAATGGGFRVTVAAGARGTLVFRGQLRAVSRSTGLIPMEFILPPLVTRHVALGTERRDPAARAYRYAISPLRGWAGDPVVAVTVEAPAGAELALDGGPWHVEKEGGRRVARARLSPRAVSELSFSLEEGGTGVVLNGGPFAAAGARLDRSAFRLRAGYEVGAGSLWLASLAAELDDGKRAAVVPLVEAALPDILFFFPSLGLGVGAPVAFGGGAPALAGVRLQAGASWPFLSLVFPLDVYPAAAGGALVTTAILGQLSF